MTQPLREINPLHNPLSNLVLKLKETEKKELTKLNVHERFFFKYIVFTSDNFLLRKLKEAVKKIYLNFNFAL